MDSLLFKEIIDQMNHDFYITFKEEVKLYKNYRLAIDGSKLTLPKYRTF